MRLWLFSILFGLMCTPLQAAEQPNILLLFADDLGYEMLGCYGGKSVPTPELDRLAEQGTRFERCYTSPVCTPSRMSVYTGTYALHHGYTTVLPIHLGSKQSVDFQKLPTVAQRLRSAGYLTSVTGKWQLAALEYHPEHCRVAGFDSWCVWQIWRGGAKTTRYWNPCLNHDGKVRDDIADRYGPDVLADYVIDQMKLAVAEKKPFYIHHNMMLPHWPILPTADDRLAGREEGSLNQMVAYLDKLVGRIVREVDQLGIAGQTYIVFMGDNGTDSKPPRETTQGLVTGKKTDLNNGGMHVPLLVRCPGQVPVGAVREDLVDAADLFPTFCELADVSISDLKLDGVSFASAMHGKEASPRQWITASYGNDAILFDGQFRWHRKGQKLIDCRDLLHEVPADLTDPPAQAAHHKLSKAMQQVTESKP